MQGIFRISLLFFYLSFIPQVLIFQTLCILTQFVGLWLFYGVNSWMSSEFQDTPLTQTHVALFKLHLNLKKVLSEDLVHLAQRGLENTHR